MELTNWINHSLPQIVDQLEKDVISSFQVETKEGLTLSGRNTIYEILDDLLAALFPGAFSKDKVDARDLNFFLGDTLRHVSFALKKIIKEILEYHCGHKTDCTKHDCEQKAQENSEKVLESLPGIRRVLLEDITAAYEGDPAAQSLFEILLSYPCIEAIATYRLAHCLYLLEVPIIPRIMAERAHSRTGIDIHPGAQIGPHFFIDHGTGVVIGETTAIGRNVKLYQGVTLGALSPLDKEGKAKRGKKRHPDIEDDVIIYSNATILGPIRIGKGSIIGGNTWITTPIPPGSVIYSNDRK